MKSASAGLISHLNTGQQFLMADLFTFTLIGGGVVRYTTAGSDIVLDGHTYLANDVIIKRSRIRTMIGVEVDTLDLTVIAQSTHLLGGVPWLTAARNGALDGAYVRVSRLFMTAWGDVSLGAPLLFEGRVASLEVGRTEARLHVNSLLEVLNIQMPRNLYQPGCLNTLYDASCTLVKASNGTASSVSSTSSTTVINCGLSQAAGFFDLGTITFTSGINNGVQRSVKSYAPGVVYLIAPLLLAPGVGDTFTAYAGCDKKQATCSGKFSNLVNFRGFPYVPAPESVL
jgi:uncharacterized phage protein (TIGR02218 family)